MGTSVNGLTVAWWRREAAVDATLAAIVAVLMLAGVAGELAGAGRPVPPALGGYALAVAAAVVLVWRRRRPALTAGVAFLVVVVYHLVGYPGEAPAAALFVTFYSLAAYGATTRSLLAALALTGLAYLIPIVPPYPWRATSPAVYAPVIGLLWLVLLGFTVRQRRIDTDDRIRRAAAVAAAETRRQLAEERLRIARELHDVLAHTISVIAVQGGAALDALDDSDNDAARQALTTIRSATKQALTEVRAALGLLRDDSQHTRPQPRLAQLPDLAARAEEAGLQVDLLVEAAAVDDLPPMVELTVYRVLQEALTNVIRHSGARSVAVTVRRQDATLLVQVTDDGAGSDAATGAGLGLTGMRERVEALSGHLTAGPAATGGGYQVTAVLPL